MRRGEITIKILEYLLETAGSASDVVAGILRAGYGASSSRMDYFIRLHRETREKEAREYTEYLRAKKKYHVFLSRLKSQGLIAEKEKKLSLTPRGLLKLKNLKNYISRRLDVPNYQISNEKAIVIVTFDVPEREKHKRVWLRGVLKQLQFRMVQRSVWLGRCKLPKEFINDLYSMKLIDYVEVFQVTKSGTLSHII